MTGRRYLDENFRVSAFHLPGKAGLERYPASNHRLDLTAFHGEHDFAEALIAGDHLVFGAAILVEQLRDDVGRRRWSGTAGDDLAAAQGIDRIDSGGHPADGQRRIVGEPPI